MIINNVQNLILEIDLNKDNNYELNFDKWISGENKILYITGLMGSGKSTFSLELSKEYNCKLIELDLLRKELSDDLQANTQGHHMEDKEFIEIFIKKINSTVKKYNRVIVEGVQVMYFNDFRTHIKDTDSVLIINTSLIKSTFRSIKRDGLTQLFNNIVNNLEFNKEKNKFITNF